MNNSGLKNNEYLSKLRISGSLAIKQKNDVGINLFEDYDLSDGVIAGKLVKPNYNTSELVKSIDTEIFELIPQSAPEGPATVLRSIYNESLVTIDNLSRQNEVLQNEVSTLNGVIGQLETSIESLRIQLDGEVLKASVAENQAIVASENVADTTIDLQNAIQNSTQEAIQRVSLTARNQSLKQEIDSLRVQIGKLDGQLSAENQARQDAAVKAASINTAVAGGADVLTENVVIKNLQEPSGTAKDIDGFGTDKNGFKQFNSGKTWEIENLGTSPISIGVTIGGDKWITASPSKTTVSPGGKSKITFNVSTLFFNNNKPKSHGAFSFAKTWDYNGTVTFKASNGDTKTFNTHLKKSPK